MNGVWKAMAALSMCAACASGAEPPGLAGELQAHDPSTILAENGRFHLFHTGPGISTKSSTNRIHWKRGERVFPQPPGWTTNAVPGFRGFFWAPDVVRVKDRYLLYYSVSTFGKQRSAIGVATSRSLDAPEWVDLGPVITSQEGDPHNTIDPGLMLDGDGRLWMAFGSFWQGIYLVELDPRTGKRVSTNSPATRLAHHAAIEAPALHRRGEHYYLFVNFGTCCRGTNSTYEIRVGRSSKVTGPYLDREGKELVKGGGTLFLANAGADIGPGHIGILAERDRELISYHVYSREDRGRSQLRIQELRWTGDGWPEAGW